MIVVNHVLRSDPTGEVASRDGTKHADGFLSTIFLLRRQAGRVPCVRNYAVTAGEGRPVEAPSGSGAYSYTQIERSSGYRFSRGCTVRASREIALPG